MDIPRKTKYIFEKLKTTRHYQTVFKQKLSPIPADCDPNDDGDSGLGEARTSSQGRVRNGDDSHDAREDAREARRCAGPSAGRRVDHQGQRGGWHRRFYDACKQLFMLPF